MTRHRFRVPRMLMSPTALAVGAVLVVAALVGAYQIVAHPREFTFTLTTQSLPVLAPHEHGPGESETDPGHAADLDSPYYIVPEDMWITSLTYAANDAPDSLIHHVTLMDFSIPAEFCDREPRIIISVDGQNDKTHTYPRPYGIFLKKGAKLLLRAEFHNPTYPEGPGQTYKDVSASIKITAVPASARSKALVPVYLALTDGANCHYIDFTVPPKTQGFVMEPKRFASSTNATYTFPSDGRIVIHGAHLHPWDGGKNVLVYINGILRYTYTPKRVGPELWQWVMPSSYQPIEVRKGDVLSLTAEYDNPLSVPVRGAMGIQMFGWYPYPACTTATSRLLRKIGMGDCTL